MGDTKQVSPQMRGAMFQLSTRQNKHMMAKQTVTSGASNMRFELPKARLLSKVMMDFSAKINIKGAAGTNIPVDEFTPYKIIRRLSLDMNNGFSPYTIGGKELCLYNAIRMNPEIIFPQESDKNGYCYFPSVSVSENGNDYEFSFTVEMPITLNDRDPIGLILLQANDSLCTITVDIANGNELFDNADVTVDIKEVTCRPMLETFSLPANAAHFPDLSTLKIVNSRTETFAGAGQNIISLPTGTTYRKIAFRITDNNGVPFEDADFLSTIDIVFNQADCNYSIDARMLRHENELQLGYALPKGCYVFDFSNNGFSNYGGTRDYIDTSLLTEMWLRFNTAKGGKVSIIMEQLSWLKSNS